jgi:hypothetical protein
MDRAELTFHKAVLEDKIPLSIGGGIGQSRLCMFLLRMAHIGESQSSIWPEDMVQKCAENGITLKFFNYHDNSINYYYVNFNLIRRLWFLMFIYLLLIIGN